jgi:hypothetical protein
MRKRLEFGDSVARQQAAATQGASKFAELTTALVWRSLLSLARARARPLEEVRTFMQKRCIKLPDGRYLIFYTFDDERSGAGKEPEITVQDDEDKSEGKNRKRGHSRNRRNPG